VTKVYLEVGSKKVFACALDWPGWCRSAKTEDLALEALEEYLPRYSAVTKTAKIPFRHGSFDVVESIKGNATTDFGAPAIVPAADDARLTAKQAERIATLLDASWQVFDRVVKQAPASLRKGPRGGGRDRDKMVAHVAAAEEAYARKLGLKHATRADILEALRSARDSTPVKDNGWPPRYAARRIAWHVLDHAWEIEDRQSSCGCVAR
jgi:hypothetical protein